MAISAKNQARYDRIKKADAERKAKASAGIGTISYKDLQAKKAQATTPKPIPKIITPISKVPTTQSKTIGPTPLKETKQPVPFPQSAPQPTVQRPQQPMQVLKPVEQVKQPQQEFDYSGILKSFDKLKGEFSDYKQTAEQERQNYMKSIPQYQTPQEYQSQMNPQMLETLRKMEEKTMGGYQFDPNDAGLNQMQDQAIGRVREDLARRGRVFDQYGAIKEQEAAQQLIPQYANMQRANYDRDLQNMGNILQAQKGLDAQGYGRFQDLQGQQRALEQSQRQDYTSGLDYGNRQAEQQRGLELEQRQIGIQDEQRQQAQEVSRYGVQLSPTMRRYEQTYQSIPQGDIARMAPYQANLAGRILELRATNPNHPDIPILESLRAMKVLSDPQLLAMYGGEYGMQSQDIQQTAEGDIAAQQQLSQQEALNQLEIVKGQISNAADIADIEKVQAEIYKIESEAQYKDTQRVAEEYKVLQEQIRASNLPREIQAEIDSVVASTAQKYASAGASRASAQRSLTAADLDRERMATESVQRNNLAIQGQKLTDEINRARTEETKGNPIKDWIDNSFAIDDYVVDPETLKQTKLGRRSLKDEDKLRIAGLLVDKVDEILELNPADMEKQIRDIEMAIDDYDLAEQYKTSKKASMGYAVRPQPATN